MDLSNITRIHTKSLNQFHEEISSLLSFSRIVIHFLSRHRLSLPLGDGSNHYCWFSCDQFHAFELSQVVLQRTFLLNFHHMYAAFSITVENSYGSLYNYWAVLHVPQATPQFALNDPVKEIIPGQCGRKPQ